MVDRLGIAAALCLMATSTSGFAQDEAALTARTHFDEGGRLYQEGQYAAAYDAFEQSFRAQPRPVAVYNMAQMLRLQGQPERAITMLQRYLQLDRDLPQERREHVEALIEELRSSMVELVIDVGPPGAEVSLDGEVIGEAPLQPLEVSVGEHRLRVTFPRYEAVNRRVFARAGGPNSVTVRLVRGEPQGRLVLTSSVSESQV